MANRMKEDEKNEKIIRGLLKLPANRRCINCNSLGPQYVCTNFWTFICTTCSGIHREFTHRVKSVSMAKFTSQEVGALQGGGNERAKEIYFKEWDPQRHSVPDSSNVERLRDFIRHVYVDRRYTGERNIDKPPRVKMGDQEDSYENRRLDTYRGGSRSPPYKDTYERRYGEISGPGPGGRNDERNFRSNYDERRSPGYDQESQRYGDYKRSPARFEVVDDRVRDDRFANARRSEDRRVLDGESRLEGRSPHCQKELNMSSPPMVRPVTDILVEDVPPLRVVEPPKENASRVADGSAHTQRTASSSSLGSIDGNSVELKRENLGSLIDFNADPEPTDTTAVPQAQPTQPPMSQSVTQPATSSFIDGGNWASFDFVTQEKVSVPPSNVNTLESVLSQLSAPAAAPIGNMSALPLSCGAPAATSVGNMPMLLATGGSPAAPAGHIPTLHGGGAPVIASLGNISISPVSGGTQTAAHGGLMSSGGDSFVKAPDGGQWPSAQQHQHSLFTATDTRSAAQQFTPSVGRAPNDSLWSSSLAPNAPGTLSTPTVQQSQAKGAQDTSSGVASQPFPVEAKSSGRTELPQDLFAATYSSVSVPAPGWQTGPLRGMGFSMQHPNAAPMPTFLHLSRSTNPFDLNTEPTQGQAPTFPSMASLQGALPTGLLHTSSLGTPSPQWMPPQPSSYASALLPQSPSYALTMPSSAYMEQQSSSNMLPFGHQGVGGLSNDGALFGTLSTNQQLAGRYSQPATPNSFSSLGGNPFG